MQEQDADRSPSGWAGRTGPDVPQAARRILLHLADNCDPATGQVSVPHRTVAKHFNQSLGWAVSNVQEQELAGLIGKGTSAGGDRRVNLYTLAGVESGWSVTTPLIPYSRHGSYLPHRRLAELERMSGTDLPAGIHGDGIAGPERANLSAR